MYKYAYMSRKPIIPPVEKALLKAELNQDTLLRTTNRAGNEYVFKVFTKSSRGA